MNVMELLTSAVEKDAADIFLIPAFSHCLRRMKKNFEENEEKYTAGQLSK